MSEVNNMRYKHYENANIDVSEIGLGTWGLDDLKWNGHGDEQEAIQTMHKLFELGVNFIDTAPAYGNGWSEKIVGKFLQQIDRSKVIVSTKFGTNIDLYTGGVYRDCSFRQVIREVASSLRNLRTNYIDIYIMHWPDVHTPIAETMMALNHLKELGYIKHIGLSNTEIPLLKEAMKYGKVDIIQPPFNMIDHRYEETMKFARENGIDVMCYGPFGGGVLTGRHREIPNWPSNDARFTFYKGFKEPMFSKVMELMKTIDAIAQKHNALPSQVVLNWTVQKPFVSTALIGVTSLKHVDENVNTFDFELSEAEMDALDQEIERLGLNK